MSTHSGDQGLFASIAALTIHDVKNNLTRLANNAQARGDLASMQVALKASQTLSTLLCFYKSENHMLDAQIDAQDPHDLIEQLIIAQSQQANDADNKQIKLDLDQAPQLWFYDPHLIQMVLANALQNAQRFAKNTITIGVRKQDELLEIYIHDDGPGYPDAVLNETEHASSISQEGTGLGLRLAQRVVQLHANAGTQGHIVLSNDQGAKFQLFLP